MVDRRLLFDGNGYPLEFTAAETETGRPYVAAVPYELTRYLHDYLQVHRGMFQSIGMAEEAGVGRRLWLGYLGKPLSSRGIERQIVQRTKEAFGRSIYPHLFRDISVTELVDSAPDEIAIAHDLLGHADLRTTRKHYVQARA